MSAMHTHTNRSTGGWIAGLQVVARLLTQQGAGVWSSATCCNKKLIPCGFPSLFGRRSPGIRLTQTVGKQTNLHALGGRFYILSRAFLKSKESERVFADKIL